MEMTDFTTWAPATLTKLVEELREENAALKADLAQASKDIKDLIAALRKEWTK